mmetsp:Transcript_9650/g.19648  ORF Transcript_9650/g.19648 Transcript_9650/m.19648 type:complete len:212 (-) Transcript_9650:585-1220(-)
MFFGDTNAVLLMVGRLLCKKPSYDLLLSLPADPLSAYGLFSSMLKESFPLPLVKAILLSCNSLFISLFTGYPRSPPDFTSYVSLPAPSFPTAAGILLAPNLSCPLCSPAIFSFTSARPRMYPASLSTLESLSCIVSDCILLSSCGLERMISFFPEKSPLLFPSCFTTNSGSLTLLDAKLEEMVVLFSESIAETESLPFCNLSVDSPPSIPI